MNIRGTYGTIYYTARMKEAVAFYEKVLGKKPSHASDGWTEFDLGGHSLCLHWQDSNEKVQTAKTCLIIKIKDLDGAIANLKKMDIRVKDKHEVHPGAYSADFFDLDGHMVSLYENTNE